MARVKLLSAMAYDRETYESSGVADPVIKVLGELPATARPFNVHRVYKGSQGVYEESMLLLDADGFVIWERAPQLIELRGMMFEDLFRNPAKADVSIESAGEHTLVFLLGGVEAGRIPVFIDAPQSVTSAGVLPEAAEAALKKGSIMWLTIPQLDGGEVSRPAWYVQQGRKVFVVKGGIEQALPNLENCDVVRMTVKSKDIKAAIGDLPMSVRVIPADSEEFDRIATLGMGTRLNLPDGEGALDRWRTDCTMVELSPAPA
jgi:hypothetical protein